MLRFMAWLCLKDNALSGSQMCIVTGPRIDLAIALIDRMKKLFSGFATVFDTKETVIDLNNVKIEAFPSHHLDAIVGCLMCLLYCWMKLTSFLPDSSKMLGMFLRGTLQNQIHIL